MLVLRRSIVEKRREAGVCCSQSRRQHPPRREVCVRIDPACLLRTSWHAIDRHCGERARTRSRTPIASRSSLYDSSTPTIASERHGSPSAGAELRGFPWPGKAPLVLWVWNLARSCSTVSTPAFLSFCAYLADTLNVNDPFEMLLFALSIGIPARSRGVVGSALCGPSCAYCSTPTTRRRFDHEIPINHI